MSSLKLSLSDCLDFSCKIWMVASEFGVNNMKAFIHPALCQWITLVWCRIFSLYCWNTKVCLCCCWPYHVHKNFWAMFPAPQWIDIRKNEGSSENKRGGVHLCTSKVYIICTHLGHHSKTSFFIIVVLLTQIHTSVSFEVAYFTHTSPLIGRIVLFILIFFP